MRRMAAALLAPVAAVAVLAGCGSSSAPAHSASANASVTVTGPEGKAPNVQIPAKAAGTGLVTKTLVHGSGPALGGTDSYLAAFNVYSWSGKTHKLLYSSYTSASAGAPGAPPQATPQVLPVAIGLPGLQTALTGAHVGSRVLAVLPPKFGYGTQGNPQIGVKPTDTLVWVIDVLQRFTATQSASGAHVSDGGGALPKVSAPPPGTSPTISIPKSPPPSKLKVTTLIKGSGPAVQPKQALVVRYVGSIWRTGKEFNNNWPSSSSPGAPPSVFVLGQVIPAWNTGLVGVPVGSRVMLVVPPADGYGKAGQSQAGIKGNDTLVFVVDILGTAV